MTRKQKETIERIKEYVLDRDCNGNNPCYEIKYFDVKEADGLVWVLVESGWKNESRIAVNYRRSRRISIGERGGVTAYVYNIKSGRTVKYKGWYNAMFWGYSS